MSFYEWYACIVYNLYDEQGLGAIYFFPAPRFFIKRLPNYFYSSEFILIINQVWCKKSNSVILAVPASVFFLFFGVAPAPGYFLSRLRLQVIFSAGSGSK